MSNKLYYILYTYIGESYSYSNHPGRIGVVGTALGLCAAHPLNVNIRFIYIMESHNPHGLYYECNKYQLVPHANA